MYDSLLLISKMGHFLFIGNSISVPENKNNFSLDPLHSDTVTINYKANNKMSMSKEMQAVFCCKVSELQITLH